MSEYRVGEGLGRWLDEEVDRRQEEFDRVRKDLGLGAITRKEQDALDRIVDRLKAGQR